MGHGDTASGLAGKDNVGAEANAATTLAGGEEVVLLAGPGGTVEGSVLPRYCSADPMELVRVPTGGEIAPIHTRFHANASVRSVNSLGLA